MGFRRSLVRIQSPRQHKARQDFEFWRAFFFRWRPLCRKLCRKPTTFLAILCLPDTDLPLLQELVGHAPRAYHFRYPCVPLSDRNKHMSWRRMELQSDSTNECERGVVKRCAVDSDPIEAHSAETA